MQTHRAEYSGTKLGLSLLLWSESLETAAERERENASQRKQSGLEGSRIRTHLNSRRLDTHKNSIVRLEWDDTEFVPSFFLFGFNLSWYLKGQFTQNENSVVIYSPLCYFKLVCCYYLKGEKTFKWQHLSCYIKGKNLHKKNKQNELIWLECVMNFCRPNQKLALPLI